MSKSSKRRLAIAAIKNAQADNPVTAHLSPPGPAVADPALPNSAKSLLQAAAETASSPPRATDIPVCVPSAFTVSLCHSATSPLSPAPSAPSSLNSSSPAQVPSAQCQVPSATPLFAAARTSLLQSSGPDPALAAITPDQIYIELPPLPPDPPSPFTNSTEPSTMQQSALPISTPAQDEFADYQAKLRTAMREWSPADPRMKTMLENYATMMQTVTLERLWSTLPTLSETAWVETNAQIVRLHSVIERTNSRYSREQREIAAQARREAREKQRKERQAQKEAEAVARNQRTKDREEARRQREQARADREEQKYQLAMRKLDLKERNLIAREKEKQEKLEHRNAAKSKESPTPPRPLGPPNTWTCG